ncbi:Thioesterase/thiol ester dehydrase-isomerase [Cantharellus anzutake]|uniref:Thioesterase/thiol ester dehydrase-isomerase n=1 Tax=Cantharellus anzutake TaxID=1750568 RepID=UPI00190355D2|nr:Thioesterase/thiol ester dehydrase-isomerase [Cantharellus anzutake]KAF8340512.1 Thioesterase/thiol ester dehydrase-isomerase [Cantharellus anzutake]
MPLRLPILWRDNLLSTAVSSPRSEITEIPAGAGTNLMPRRMHESYAQVTLPFASDPHLLDSYTNANGGIRTGKIMEHLDSLAGSVAYKHALGPAVESLGSIILEGFYFVTASIDRLDMLQPLTPQDTSDLRISGQVIFVGASSMEVAIKLESVNETTGEEKTVMIGEFSMVCRDAVTHKAQKLNPLILETETERELFHIGKVGKERKKKISLLSLSRSPPCEDESSLIHSLFVVHQPFTDSKGRPLETTPMGNTMLESTALMHPQDRNFHTTDDFSGYLMRLAYEIGYSTATLFANRPLRFFSLDNTTFKLPVPVGSILRLQSKVTHTKSGAANFRSDRHASLVNVRVQADVLDVKTGDKKTTNEFQFTWGDDHTLHKTVIPVTYIEAMEWLEGRRALDVGDQIRKFRS